MTIVTVDIENQIDLNALRYFLDSKGMTYTIEEEDEELEASIKRGIEQSKAGLGRPHDVVWAEKKAKYPSAFKIQGERGAD